MDHTLKLWDLRFGQSPVEVWADLPNSSITTNSILCNNVIMTGVSPDGNMSGKIVMIDGSTFEKIGEIESDCHVGFLKYHEGLG
jgi:hypothetical protein